VKLGNVSLERQPVGWCTWNILSCLSFVWLFVQPVDINIKIKRTVAPATKRQFMRRCGGSWCKASRILDLGNRRQWLVSIALQYCYSSERTSGSQRTWSWTGPDPFCPEWWFSQHTAKKVNASPFTCPETLRSSTNAARGLKEHTVHILCLEVCGHFWEILRAERIHCTHTVFESMWALLGNPQGWKNTPYTYCVWKYVGTSGKSSGLKEYTVHILCLEVCGHF